LPSLASNLDPPDLCLLSSCDYRHELLVLSFFFFLIIGKYMLIKSDLEAGHWWLMPVIIATWEAEIRRIVVQSQPGQIVL
jgi:hypothetical protein